MKIILSTYNFYPTHKGGTEVYTSAFARYLMGQGHEVLIIAAYDKGMDMAGNAALLLDHIGMKVTGYTCQGLSVAGVELKQQSADDVYAAMNPLWTDGFTQLLTQTGWNDSAALYMNGFTTVSGLSLCDALLQKKPDVQIRVVVHTPFICPKGDMIFAGTKTRCQVEIHPATCAACMLCEQIRMPYPAGRVAAGLLRLAYAAGLSKSTATRLQYLIQKKIDAFDWLDQKVQQWVVFSEDMKHFMSRQSFVSPDKVLVIRHGIDKAVFAAGAGQKPAIPLTFLYAGRFEEIKGVKVLAEAWEMLDEKPAERKLYLAGNWNESTTGRAVNQLLGNRQDVEFIATLPQTDLAERYRNTHCVVIPSRWVETGPMVIHEAVACGCDIISSDIGGQGELAAVYSDKAISFQSGNSRSLQQAIMHYKPVDKKSRYIAMSTAEHFEKLSGNLL